MSQGSSPDLVFWTISSISGNPCDVYVSRNFAQSLPTGSSDEPDFKAINLLVPLYKRMYLEAADAYAVARYILEHESFGIAVRCSSFAKKGEKSIVLRLFLASNRTYKKFRMEHSKNQSNYYRELYSMIPLPRFVWIAELFYKEDYLKSDGKAFAEYVLDATSSTKNDIKSIIMLNYPDSISVRWPDSPISMLNDRFDERLVLLPFTRFSGNLEDVRGCC